MSSLPDKILVVRLGAIGDVVNALVFATALKRAYPHIEIGWAVHALSAPLVHDHPMVDRVHVWHRERPVRGFLAMVSEVRRERYELAIDLQRIFKSAALARLSGARRVLGYDRARTKEASYWWSNEHIPPADPGAHMVEQYLEVARHLGIREARAEHLLPADDEAASWAAAVCAELGQAPVIINIGASKPENRWLPERFGQLARRCMDELGATVCFTGGPADVEAARSASAAAGTPVARLRNLTGQTSLRQLAALLARARLFIGCDTGPMHLAVASGVRVIALFGPADPRRTGPFGDTHIVVRATPEATPGIPRNLDMGSISVEHVFECVDASLRDNHLIRREPGSHSA